MKKKLISLLCCILLDIAEHGYSAEVNCVREGFTVVESENCGEYYYCVKSLNEEFYAIKFECPFGEEFSLQDLKCMTENNSVCGILPEAPVDDTLLSKEFVCPSVGSFPQIKSQDCKQYYICNNSIEPVLNTCSTTEIFSWESLQCVAETDFKCPNTKTFKNDVTRLASEESTEIHDNFECQTFGRFADPQSIDCRSYYLCIASDNDEITAILSQCPSTTVFSPVVRKCVATSQYVCIVTTTTLEPTTTETATSTQATSTVETTIIESTHETTMAVTTPGPSSFNCVTSGRFADPESIDCKSYYLCTENLDGVLEVTLNKCPAITIFNPESGRCVLPTDYLCQVEETTTIIASTSDSSTEIITTEESSTSIHTTEITIPTSEMPHTNVPTTSTSSPGESYTCSDLGRYPDPLSTDCKGYYLCTNNNEGGFKATLNRCPSVTVFQPDVGKCVNPADYQCALRETTTPYPTDKTTILSTNVPTETTASATNPPGELFSCAKNGYFPDPQSSYCVTYYLCIEITDGVFEATLKNCPLNTVFNPENGTCVSPTIYQCPQQGTTITTTEGSISITTVNSTPPAFTTAEPQPEKTICTSVGRFPDMTSLDCKRYYLCSTSESGAYEAVLTQCPSVTIFSLDQNRCVPMSQYKCPLTITTSTVDPTTLETTVSAAPTTLTSTSPGDFTCTTIGRHADPADCSKYKFCLQTATNQFIEYTFKCPIGSFFNPQELRCTTGDGCWTEPPTVTTDLIATTTSFYCSSDGRFLDPTSEGCDRYVMCLKTAIGSYQKYNFKCPNGSSFNPAETKCSSNYSCV